MCKGNVDANCCGCEVLVNKKIVGPKVIRTDSVPTFNDCCNLCEFDTPCELASYRETLVMRICVGCKSLRHDLASGICELMDGTGYVMNAEGQTSGYPGNVDPEPTAEYSPTKT